MAFAESFSTPVSYSCDVLVVGGGFAGISAAVAAARSGKSVILAERMFILGGLGTAGLVTIYLPLCDGLGHQVSFGLSEELLRLSIDISNDGKRGIPNWISSCDPSGRTENDPRFEVNFNPNLFAIQIEQLLQDLHVKILYGTYAVSSVTENGRLSAVIFESKSGRFGICAGSYVDATGDADLATFSGVPVQLFGEKNLLAAWYYFTSKDERFRLNTLGAADITPDFKIQKPKIKPLSDRRFAGVNGEEISEFVQLSHRATLNHVLSKRIQDPTYEPVMIAGIPQIRMTRRIEGEYTLDACEMHVEFPDSVGMISDWRKRGPVYEVPFRTLFSSKIRNLIFAGRCTSVTDSMWDIMRVIPCCCVTGEAAGLAAASSDDFTSLDVAVLQDHLRSRGVCIHENELLR